MANKDLVDLLQSRGFDVSSPSSSIADIYAEDLLREFGTKETADQESRPVDGRSLPANPPPAPDLDPAQPQIGEIVQPTVGKEVVQPRQSFTVARQTHVMERPRILPMERIQSSVRAQNNRFSGRGDGRRPDFFHGQRSGGNWPSPDGGKAAADEGRAQGSFGRGGGGRGFFGERKAFPGGQRRTDGNFSQRGGFTAPKLAPQSMPRPPIPVPLQRPAPVPAVEPVAKPVGTVLRLKFPLSVREFAPEIGLKPFQLIAELMQSGTFASMNYLLDEVRARKIAEKFGYSVEVAPMAVARPAIDQKQRSTKKIAADAVLESRPPVVCVLGHVDHGKTTLLDTIRKANVVAGEAGGITQHIGAYAVAVNGRSITFIDTPGHAAFSKMRERGANITDVAVLVVAADDGFMPQTDEALKFAQRAGVPVVVAINKMDAPGANAERVKQQMQQRGIPPEEWGGETLCGTISALHGDGIDRLLELVLVQAEMLTLQADFHAPVQGVVVESQMEVGRGPTATVIVQEGTLCVGDVLVCGGECCKVRALMDDRGKAVRNATPSCPVRVMGWSAPLESGATFSQAKDEKEARLEAEKNRRDAGMGDGAPVVRTAEDKAEGLEALFAAIHAKKKKVLHVLIKGDAQGSVEALVACLEALPQDKIGLEIVRAEVGPVSVGDVEFARPADATIVAFHTRLENGVQALLKRHAIPLIQHNIIYEMVDRVREAMADLLEPELREEKLGGAQVRQIFTLSKGTVAGCMVTEGKIARDALFRVFRDGKRLFEGRAASLRRGKEDIGEVRAGYECGIVMAGFVDHAVGDTVECFRIHKIRPNL